MIFAWLLIAVGFMSGMPTPVDYAENRVVTNPRLTVTIVEPDSPAAQGDLRSGDVLTKLEADAQILENLSPEGVSEFVAAHAEREISFFYERGGQTGSVSVTPSEGVVAGKKAVGISMDMIGTLQLGPVAALWEGGKTTISLTEAVVVGLWDFFAQAFQGEANLNQVSGPVGIVGLVGNATELGFIYLLSFTAIISIHLAVINLVPFPALDGGRLLFVLIEKVKGKPISPRVVNAVNGVGFVLLLVLMVVITVNDIFKLF